jgi:hypothetical protein
MVCCGQMSIDHLHSRKHFYDSPTESAAAYSLLTRDTKFPIFQGKKGVIKDST